MSARPAAPDPPDRAGMSARPAASARPTRSARPDRAGAVRAALRRLVAERGFHGASMGAVAREAGVATGTAYVHYASKDELVVAAYAETKLRLGEAAVAAVDPAEPPERRFRALWVAAYGHLLEHPDDARFLIQVDGSPYAGAAHAAVVEREDDPLLRAAGAPDMAGRLLELPLDVIYELGLAPATRLVARGVALSGEQVATVAEACWRAISRPG